jgi:hypothetical protein
MTGMHEQVNRFVQSNLTLQPPSQSRYFGGVSGAAISKTVQRD